MKTITLWITGPVYWFCLGFFLLGCAHFFLKSLGFNAAGRPKQWAPPRERPGNGIAYAFTLGMLPWKKDLARAHRAVYVAGVLYHLGILTAVTFFFLRPRLSAHSVITTILMLFMALGLAGGVALYIRRSVNRFTQPVSTLDDFFSNLLTDLFILCGLVSAGHEDRSVLFYLAFEALLLYIPFSKIKHFMFFWVTRAMFGMEMGRLGAYRQALQPKGQDVHARACRSQRSVNAV